MKEDSEGFVLKRPSNMYVTPKVLNNNDSFYI